MNRRIEEIDVIKGIGIIFMVVGHSGSPITHFVYLFHMALFIIASGCCYKTSASSSIRQVGVTLFKKIKSLWVPFFIWNAIYLILNNVFIAINVYSDNPEFLEFCGGGGYNQLAEHLSGASILRGIARGAVFFGNTQMGGGFWFLKALFGVSILYCTVDYVLRKLNLETIKAQFAVSIIMLGFGYWSSLRKEAYYGIAVMLSCYCLFYAGVVLKTKWEEYWNLIDKHSHIIGIVSCVLLCVLNEWGSIALGTNDYENPIFLLLTSLLGWNMVCSLVSIIKRIEPIKHCLALCGKRSLSILILHFLSFKLVSAFVCLVYRLPAYCIASFPNLYGERGLWWTAYTIVGTMIPILAYQFALKIYEYLRQVFGIRMRDSF